MKYIQNEIIFTGSKAFKYKNLIGALASLLALAYVARNPLSMLHEQVPNEIPISSKLKFILQAACFDSCSVFVCLYILLDFFFC